MKIQGYNRTSDIFFSLYEIVKYKPTAESLQVKQLQPFKKLYAVFCIKNCYE